LRPLEFERTFAVTAEAVKLNKVETVKAHSRHLRGPVDTELQNDADHFSEDSGVILKFHGIYQQDDRDLRKSRKAQGLGPDYSFMIRVAIPGGVLTPEQYLELDALSDKLANATMRITTRQAIQYHGVRKGGLKPLMAILNQHLLTTLSACGDVVRNVVACPAPFVNRQRSEIMAHAFDLSRKLKPKARAYYELWLDGEKAASAEEEEPLYGNTYLPRKFKIGFAFPGDNCVDAYTQDVGVVPVLDGAGNLEAFTLIVGGGLGQSHTVKETHPRLGDPMTTVKPDQLAAVVEAVVKVQRDHGRRDDRKFSRMKYLVEAWGITRFREKVAEYLGYALQPAQPLEWTSGEDHLGWFEQGDGKLFLGLFIENGRVKDNLRAGLREIVSRFRVDVRLTPQQNILLVNIDPQIRADLETVLKAHGVALPETVRPVVRQAMACPAFPTCGLAITEAERVMPDVIREIDALLTEVGLERAPAPTVRMTGCPNGCARPYSAEIGLVGRSLNSYAVYLGGSHLGTRLAREYLDNVPREKLRETLKPLFEAYREARGEDEFFGDFVQRVGFEAFKT
jgi:sulfite reductase (ferredoxin)